MWKAYYKTCPDLAPWPDLPQAQSWHDLNISPKLAANKFWSGFNFGLLRIHQKLLDVEISIAFNSVIIKDNIMEVNIIRTLVEFTI